MRIFTTSQPDQNPLEVRVSPTGTDEAITKLSWLPGSDNLLVVSKRSGVIEKWDLRTPTAPVISQLVEKSMTIQDLELSPLHKTILVACNQKVCWVT
jgi:WD40 repeat protein